MEELGRFKLRAEIDAGPYMVAYEADDGPQRCVVKVLKDEAVPSEPGRRAGLVRALEGLATIEHPSVVRVLAAGEESGKLFVTTELMESPTLEQKLQEENRLAEQQVVLFVRQAAQALDKARDLGYSHGDLSAAKVFVVSEEKIKLADFSLKALVEAPPDIADIQAEGTAGTGGVGEDEWVTAEELLRGKGRRAITERLDEDFTAVAVLMMRMLGVAVPDRAEGEPLDAYRNNLLRSAYVQVSSPETGVSVHTSEVVRRLLTKDGFDTPGEVVVELASAMLLGRTFGRARPEPVPRPPAETETAEARVPSEPALELEPSSAAEVTVAEPQPSEVSGALMAFYIWNDRRSGRFFVVHDGERLTVGRDPDVCDVTLLDAAASRQHCIVSMQGGAVRIEDADSSNGTFVNGERVEGSDLRPGDRVRVGTTRIYTSLPRQSG